MGNPPQINVEETYSEK